MLADEQVPPAQITWLVLLMLAPVGPASADMAMPTWVVGDFWEYHVAGSETTMHTDGRIRRRAGQ